MYFTCFIVGMEKGGGEFTKKHFIVQTPIDCILCSMNGDDRGKWHDLLLWFVYVTVFDKRIKIACFINYCMKMSFFE